MQGITRKVVVSVVLLTLVSTAYAGKDAKGFVSDQLAGLLNKMVEQGKEALRKYIDLELLQKQTLQEMGEIKKTNETMGETLGPSTPLDNGDKKNQYMAARIDSTQNHPQKTLTSSQIMGLPKSTPTPTETPIDFSGVHKKVETTLTAKDNSQDERIRLAKMREFMMEDGAITGISLAAVNKQNIEQTKALIKNNGEFATHTKNLREDLLANNLFLMMLTHEMIQLREIQAQQLEMMAVFMKGFSDPDTYLSHKNELRAARDGGSL